MSMPPSIVHEKLSNPLISVIIATRNEEAHIRETLQTLVDQELSPGTIELIVVDGGSTDRTLEIVRGFSEYFTKLVVLHNPRILSASGWNIGLTHSTAPVISILSGHVLLPIAYIQTMLNVLDKTMAGVGVRTMPIGETRQSELIAKAFSSKLGNGGASFMSKGKSGPVESIAFGCYWKSHITDIGGFDECIVRGQDWDLNLRLRASGQTLWLHDGLETFYYTRTSYQALWKRQFLAGRWKRYIHEKSSKPFLARHCIPSAFVLAFCFSTIASTVWPPMIYLSTSIILSHLIGTLFQMRSLNISWHSALPFWWALLLIHVGYGAGMISGFISPVKPHRVDASN